MMMKVLNLVVTIVLVHLDESTGLVIQPDPPNPSPF